MMRVFKGVIKRVIEHNVIEFEVDLGFCMFISIPFRLSLVNNINPIEETEKAKLFLLKYIDVPMMLVSSKPDAQGYWLGEFWRQSEFATGAASINKILLQLKLVRGLSDAN